MENVSVRDQKTVLVVDDEAVQLRMLSSLLSKRGYCVLTANRGAEALQILEDLQQHHQLKMLKAVILDIMMPIMDGLTTLKLIQMRYMGLPVIMCSALNERDVVVKAIQLGARDYLLKPFQPAMLFEKLEALDNEEWVNSQHTAHAAVHSYAPEPFIW